MENVFNVVVAYLILIGAITVGFLVVKLPGVRKSFLPASVAAGLLLLLLGPELLGMTSSNFALDFDLYKQWEPLPALLINVIFAALFIGRPLVSLKKMWSMAAPQAAFGQMIAWGYYMVGGLIALFITIPLLGASPLSAALMEISFEGGHGTSAGMIPVFNELDYQVGQEMSVALATTSLVSTLIVGFLLIGYGHRKGHIGHRGVFAEIKGMVYHRRVIHELKEQGVTLRHELSVRNFITHIIMLTLGVLGGMAIHKGLLTIEQLAWGKNDVKIFGYMPVFTFCMFGGMAVQAAWSRLGWKVSRPVVELLSGATLALLVTTAIGTMKLDFVTSDGLTFLAIALGGVSWVVFCFLVLAPRMFKKQWFTNGIVSIGQSMGTTATGLLFARVVDPKQRTRVVESFGYKQLLFEPVMGGGIATALSMPMIVSFGLVPFTIVCSVVSIGWMLLGVFVLGRKR